jgi:hypothetical protein
MAGYRIVYDVEVRRHNRFRVLYRIADTLEVYVLAVGIKDANRLLIGGEEFEL